MTPTPEIIDLARRFNELGGTKGYEYHKDDQFLILSPTGELIDILRLSSFDGEFITFGRTVVCSKLCVPVLTESELWAWLWRQEIKVTQDFDRFRILRFNSSFAKWNILFELPEKIEDLHHALYFAAVWVAERKAK